MESEAAPRGSRLERKKEETRQKIIGVAMALFEEQGFEPTTMEQIADRADIARGTLYNYFPSKEAIISEYVQRTFQTRKPARLGELRTLPDTRSRLILILTELMEGVQAQKVIFEKFLAHRIQNVVSLRPPQEESAKSGFDLLAGEIVRLGQASGELRADLPPDMLVDLFEFVFVEVAKQFYTHPDTFIIHAAVEQGADLFIHGAGSKT